MRRDGHRAVHHRALLRQRMRAVEHQSPLKRWAFRQGEGVARAVPIVQSTPLDTTFTLPFGTITLEVYLPTRIVEIVVHTDDICRAIGHEPVATIDEVHQVLAVAGAASGRHSGLDIIRAVMGRAPLPDGFNLWG